MRVLVIKLGALGDFVLAFGPFAAIRAHHRADHVTLLTTAPFAGLARQSPWFDEVVVDARPAWWDLGGLRRLRGALQGFDFVYDLQTSGRSSRYHRLAGNPPWSGIAPGASHKHSNPGRNHMHTVERQRDQLEAAGIACFPAPDLAWLTEAGPRLPAPYAVLAPGSAPHRPEKRWPAERFGALARLLQDRGILPVVVGAAADAALAAAIQAACPDALDLTGRTSLLDLGGLAARAALAVGNDTGPMHLAAAVACPCIVLFSGASDPALTAPRGRVSVIREQNLADLPVERVAAAIP
ncbi:MAG TPA: glycosyltransferase family 9 protein [Acetobacteraceae bacterium]|nr:glycosyltransferase family 9 protein [Acetobacteraceae bacterium]